MTDKISINTAKAKTVDNQSQNNQVAKFGISDTYICPDPKLKEAPCKSGGSGNPGEDKATTA